MEYQYLLPDNYKYELENNRLRIENDKLKIEKDAETVIATKNIDLDIAREKTKQVAIEKGYDLSKIFGNVVEHNFKPKPKKNIKVIDLW